MGLAVATVAQIRQPGRLPRKSWCHLMWNSRVLTKNWSQKLLRRWRQICVLFATVFGNFPAAFGRWRQGLSWGYFPQEATHRKVRFSPAVKALVEGLLKVFWSFHSCFLWQSSRPSEIRSEHAVGVFGLFQVVPSCSKLFQVVPMFQVVPRFLLRQVKAQLPWHGLACLEMPQISGHHFWERITKRAGLGLIINKLPGCLYHVWSWRCCASFLHGAALRSGADRRHFGISINEWGITKMFFWPLALVLCDSGRDNQLRVKSPPMIGIINLKNANKKQNKIRGQSNARMQNYKCRIECIRMHPLRVITKMVVY